MLIPHPICTVSQYVVRTGVRYEGEWKDGREHGAGTLVETDGSTFYGFWVDGRRHGDGVRWLAHMLGLCMVWFAGVVLHMSHMDGKVS